jgi:hypothetical protein
MSIRRLVLRQSVQPRIQSYLNRLMMVQSTILIQQRDFVYRNYHCAIMIAMLSKRASSTANISLRYLSNRSHASRTTHVFYHALWWAMKLPCPIRSRPRARPSCPPFRLYLSVHAVDTAPFRTNLPHTVLPASMTTIACVRRRE